MSDSRETEGDTDFGAFEGVRERRMHISVAEFGNLLKMVEKNFNAAQDQRLINEKLTLTLERQKEKISDMETDIGKLYTITGNTDKILDRWIQRGFAVWGVLVMLWVLFQFFGPKFIPSLGG